MSFLPDEQFAVEMGIKKSEQQQFIYKFIYIYKWIYSNTHSSETKGWITKLDICSRVWIQYEYHWGRNQIVHRN